MKAKVTSEQLRERLVKVFASAAESAAYNSENEQYQGICGWCGVMAPLSRPAYIKEFGAAAVMEAETAARAELAARRKEYAASDWAKYKAQADRHKADGEPVPAVGQMVWGLCSWLKCDGGRGFIDELENQEICNNSDDMDTHVRPVLLKVDKVITVTADEIDRPGLADELTAGGDMPGGCTYEEDDRLKLIAPYNMSYTHVTAVTDGTKYFYIDSEGYNYARYIAFPGQWQTFFAPQLEAYRQEVARKKAAKEKAEQEEHEKAKAAYIGRCKKWGNLMQPVTDLEKQLRAANYGTAESKAISRKLNTVRRANILAMCRAAFPGLKFSLKQNKGWGESWNLTYTDGPTLGAFKKAVDLDLFATHYDTFNSYDDSSDVVYKDSDFIGFARKYMGSNGTKGVKVEREMSDETRAALRAKALQTVPGLTEGDSIHRDRLTGEQDEAICQLVGLDWSRMWISPEGLALEMFEKLDLYTRPENSPKAAKADAQAYREASTDEQHAQAPSGTLTAEEYGERATVVRGYDDTQYKELIVMGGKYNRRLQGGPGIIFSTKKHGAEIAEYIARHTA